jgi:circadian clock protein KaiB
MKKTTESFWEFQLYLAGNSPRNDRALAMLESICQQHLEGKYDIEVIDITQDRLTAMRENILATPTLIKQLPEPAQRFIGEFSDKEKLILILQITAKE